MTNANSKDYIKTKFGLFKEDYELIENFEELNKSFSPILQFFFSN
jgi:hypothetical protein